MNIAKAHHEFKLKTSKLDSNHNADLPSAFIDDLLYEALLDYIEIFFSGNFAKPYKLGFEVTQQRIDMLSHFVQQIENLSPSNQNAYYLYFRYIYDLSQLKPEYLHFVSGEYITDCGIIQFDIDRHNLNINNSFQKPSRKWNSIIPLMRDNKLIVTAGSNYLPNPNLTYIRKPQRPFLGNYNTLEFTQGDLQSPSNGDNPIDLDINDEYANIVIDLAVQNFSGIFDNNNQVAYIDNKIIKTT